MPEEGQHTETPGTKRISQKTPSDVRYAVELKLEDVYDNVALLSSRIYQVCSTARTDPAIMHSVTSFVDTGVVPNLINAEFIRLQWNSGLELQEVPFLQTAKKQSFGVNGTIFLHVRIGYLCARLWL